MARRGIEFWQVDAFTATPFSGNPAAVCLLDDAISDDIMQKIAAENNLAETAFVEPMPDRPPNAFTMASDFKLRWFTPTNEVPLCGHATLASAAALFECLGNTSDALRFHTASGILTVKRHAHGSGTGTGGGRGIRMEMALPLAEPSTSGMPSCAEAVVAACTQQLEVEQLAFAAEHGLKYLLVCLKPGTSRQQLELLQPDLDGMMAAATAGEVRGVVVTVHGGDSGYDLLSRFFAPWMGIPEDSVTGSAHSVLGPFWQQRLGRPDLTARQCSQRGGELQLRVDHGSRRVMVSGTAVIMIEGTFYL